MRAALLGLRRGLLRDETVSLGLECRDGRGRYASRNGEAYLLCGQR